MPIKNYRIPAGLHVCLIPFLMGLSSSGHADSFEPVAHCYKPDKPLMFSTRYYKNRYAQDADEYRRCLKTFIEHQEYAAKVHKQAAMNALKTWKDFSGQQ